MKKSLIVLFSLLVLAGCAILAPYNITFTTPAHSAVNPFTDTLDFALSQPAMAYISEVDCEGNDPVALLPVVSAEMTTSNVHNLNLELLAPYEATTECNVRVTVFDQTTTATTSGLISLYVLEKPIETEEYAEQMLACEEANGEWNACGSSCEEGDEFCVQVCVPQCEFNDEEVLETETTSLVEVAAQTQESCVDSGGQWNISCDESNSCEEWCDAAVTEEAND